MKKPVSTILFSFVVWTAAIWAAAGILFLFARYIRG
jgi:hypothetical protein